MRDQVLEEVEMAFDLPGVNMHFCICEFGDSGKFLVLCLIGIIFFPSPLLNIMH